MAGTNNNTVVAHSTCIFGIQAYNNGSTPAYLKIYAQNAGPINVNTQNPIAIIMIPGNTSGAGNNVPLPPNIFQMPLGFTISITGLPAFTDTTAIGAGQVVVNIQHSDNTRS